MPLDVGSVVEGVVSKITHFGAFIKLADGTVGLLHISQIADSFVKDVSDFLKEGQNVSVRVLGFDDKGRPDFSMKSLKMPAGQEKKRSDPMRNMAFEDKLSRFLKESEERQLDLQKNLENKRR